MAIWVVVIIFVSSGNPTSLRRTTVEELQLMLRDKAFAIMEKILNAKQTSSVPNPKPYISPIIPSKGTPSFGGFLLLQMPAILLPAACASILWPALVLGLGFRL